MITGLNSLDDGIAQLSQGASALDSGLEQLNEGGSQLTAEPILIYLQRNA